MITIPPVLRRMIVRMFGHMTFKQVLDHLTPKEVLANLKLLLRNVNPHELSPKWERRIKKLIVFMETHLNEGDGKNAAASFTEPFAAKSTDHHTLKEIRQVWGEIHRYFQEKNHYSWQGIKHLWQEIRRYFEQNGRKWYVELGKELLIGLGIYLFFDEGMEQLHRWRKDKPEPSTPKQLPALVPVLLPRIPDSITANEAQSDAPEVEDAEVEVVPTLSRREKRWEAATNMMGLLCAVFAVKYFGPTAQKWFPKEFATLVDAGIFLTGFAVVFISAKVRHHRAVKQATEALRNKPKHFWSRWTSRRQRKTDKKEKKTEAKRLNAEIKAEAKRKAAEAAEEKRKATEAAAAKAEADRLAATLTKKEKAHPPHQGHGETPEWEEDAEWWSKKGNPSLHIWGLAFALLILVMFVGAVLTYREPQPQIVVRMSEAGHEALVEKEGGWIDLPANTTLRIEIDSQYYGCQVSTDPPQAPLVVNSDGDINKVGLHYFIKGYPSWISAGNPKGNIVRTNLLFYRHHR